MPSITVNDVDLYYELTGPHGAPVVAFSNSIGTTLEMWDAQAEALSPHYRCLRYDTRGHGRPRSPTIQPTSPISPMIWPVCSMPWLSRRHTSLACRSAA
jgi:pimeloyl-ACP methyl ester carboxylesterase